MRCLIVAPEIEDVNARGIQVVTKHLVRAAFRQGWQVSLLTGHLSPREDSNLQPTINEKMQFVYLKHYLAKGRESFGLISNLTNNPFIALGIILKQFFQVRKEILVPHTSAHLDLPILDYLYSAIPMPYIYHLFNSGFPQLASFLLQKVVDTYHIDVVVATSPIAIQKIKENYKLVQMFYDFIPLELTEEPMENKNIVRFAKRADQAIRFADLILSDSEFTEQQVREIRPDVATYSVFSGLSSEQYTGLSNEINSSILNVHKLEKEKYLLFISAIEERKNVLRMMKAFVSISSETTVKLVLVGKPGYRYEQVKQYWTSLPLDIQQRIIFTGYVTDYDKFTLIHNAFALLLLSPMEGFGIPVLEALRFECPVITTYSSGLREIGGDAVLYVQNPYSEAEIITVLRQLVGNASWRKELIVRGLNQSKFFTEELFDVRFTEAMHKLNL